MNGPCSAVPIPAPYTKSIFVFANTAGASTSSSSRCYSYDSGPVVWYTIAPTAGVNVTLTTCNAGTNFDTVISVYSGTCNSLSCVVYNDDASCSRNATGNLSTLTFLPLSTAVYYVGIGGYSSAQGSFEFTISQPNITTTSNPGCLSAINVPGPYSPEIIVFGGNTNATGYTDSTCGLSSAQHTVWYHISPIVGVPLTVSTCNSATNFDTYIAVFSGVNCNNITCSGFNDNNCTTYYSSASQIVFTPTINSYYVTVSGISTAQGTFEISFSQEQGSSGSTCSNALNVYPNTIQYGSSVGAPTSLYDPCNVLSDHATVWLHLVLTSYNTVTVSTCESATNFDTYLVILSASPNQCNSFTCVTYNDDYSCSYASGASTVTFSPYSSLSYYILISGYGGAVGNYGLSISQ